MVFNSETTFKFLLTAFLIAIVFDPSDSVLGLKLYILTTLFLMWAIRSSSLNNFNYRVEPLFIFLLFGLFFPLFSIFIFYFRNGILEDYQGFNELKGYLSLYLLVILSAYRIDFISIFLWVIVIQVFVTILIMLILTIYPEFFTAFSNYGFDYGFLWINLKSYAEVNFIQVFFKTAPFMVFPLSYFSYNFFNHYFNKRNVKIFDLLFLICSVFALFISGTRANIFIAILVPVYYVFIFCGGGRLSGKILFGLTIFVFLIIVTIYNFDTLTYMLDPNEFSNAIKIGYLNDYIKIFSDPVTLAFGQGIGSSYFFESVGQDFLITELTIPELFRRFGLVLSSFYLVLFIAPIWMLNKKGLRSYRWVRVGYISYLIVSLSNYFLLSSTGFILLSMIYGICFGFISNKSIAKINYKIA
jgi:hypothetical protein